MLGKISFRLKNVMAYMPFAYYYVGPIAFASYLMAGRTLFCRFSRWGLSYCIGFALYVLWLLLENGVVDGLYVVRFFWGFLLFYFVFKTGIQIQVNKLLVFLSALTIAEAVLVNTIISAEILPNYPSKINAAGHFSAVGEYQRPYSFGGSASVTGVTLAALLAVSTLGWKGKSLTIVAILACMSGSGFVALFIFFLAVAPRPVIFLLVPAFVGVIYSEEIPKISAGYLSLLVELKANQTVNELRADLFSLLMGVPLATRTASSYGGDFAALSFLVLNGLVGLGFLLIIIFSNVNKRNWLSILIMLIGTFHYGAMFYLPGQLLLGYFLNITSATGGLVSKKT